MRRGHHTLDRHRLYAVEERHVIYAGESHDGIETAAANYEHLGTNGGANRSGGVIGELTEYHYGDGDGNVLVARELRIDVMYGNGGDDYLYSLDRADRVYGGAGRDHLYAGIGDDQLYGDDGDWSDWVYGGPGNDVVYGGLGDGAGGPLGDQAVDYLFGGSGHDVVYGFDGNDYSYGDSGDDRLYGHSGNDVLEGGSGNDTIYGSDGQDWLFGGTGNDILYGGNQADLIIGGTGIDKLYGGAGADIFHFNAADAGGYLYDAEYGGYVSGYQDFIYDFQENDVIRLQGSYSFAGRNPNPGEGQYSVWWNSIAQAWSVSWNSPDDNLRHDITVYGADPTGNILFVV